MPFLSVREITPEDAAPVAALSSELGYPATPEVIQERIHHLANVRDQAVYVAVLDRKVVGWVGVAIVHHLQSDPYGDITGLIVSSEYRSQNIGRELVAKAEQWTAERGITRMLVRSNIIRERAHRFYLREGYIQTKTSAVFTKSLA